MGFFSQMGANSGLPGGGFLGGAIDDVFSGIGNGGLLSGTLGDWVEMVDSGIIDDMFDTTINTGASSNSGNNFSTNPFSPPSSSGFSAGNFGWGSSGNNSSTSSSSMESSDWIFPVVAIVGLFLFFKNK